MKKRIYTLISLLLVAGSASAIIVVDYVTATNAPTGTWNINWNYVYSYKNCSSVAVGSHWLLTAAHVADDNRDSYIVVNGVTNYQQEIIFHSSAHDSEHTNSADLALVRFDKEFSGYYPLYTGDFPTNDRLNAVMIGYGITGTVYSNYFVFGSGGNGTKRWGSQKIDGTDFAEYPNVDDRVNPPVTNWTYNDGIGMLFDLSDTTYEVGAGVYDSGSGTFVKDGGTWKLAGINTTLYGTWPNWTGTFAVSVPAYATWVTKVINPTGDLDSDGLPNYWEQKYGTTTGMVASADSDLDGLTNYREYIADTVPTNSASFFQNTGELTLDNQTFYFNGSTARQYQVFYTTNDLAATNLMWIAANTSKVWGTGTNSFITVTNTADLVFYRLWVTLP